MYKKIATQLLMGTLLVTLLTGCLYSREIAGIRGDIEKQYPEATLEREVVFSIGSGTLGAVGWIAGRVPEEEAQMASAYLDEIDRIKVGVYNVHDLPALDDVELARLKRFEKNGWEVAVKSREEDQVVWVLYRDYFDRVRDIFVLSLDQEDLVIVRIEGYLDRLLEKVVQDHATVDGLLAEVTGW